MLVLVGKQFLSRTRKSEIAISIKKGLFGKKSSVDKKLTTNKKLKSIQFKKHVTFGKKLLKDMTTDEVKQELCKILNWKYCQILNVRSRHTDKRWNGTNRRSRKLSFWTNALKRIWLMDFLLIPNFRRLWTDSKQDVQRSCKRCLFWVVDNVKDAVCSCHEDYHAPCRTWDDVDPLNAYTSHSCPGWEDLRH